MKLIEKMACEHVGPMSVNVSFEVLRLRIEDFEAGFRAAREMAAELEALEYEPFAESFRQLGEEEVPEPVTTPQPE